MIGTFSFFQFREAVISRIDQTILALAKLCLVKWNVQMEIHLILVEAFKKIVLHQMYCIEIEAHALALMKLVCFSQYTPNMNLELADRH